MTDEIEVDTDSDTVDTDTDDEVTDEIEVDDDDVEEPPAAERAAGDDGLDDEAEELVDEAVTTEDPIESDAVPDEVTQPDLTESAAEPIVEPQPAVPVPSTTAPTPPPAEAGSWAMADLRRIAAPALAALAVFGTVGFALGFSRGPEETVRREFVYTLDESVPDSFLREDRRLLTQIVTLQSDAVLTPVAAEFDLAVEDLRDKISVETVDLSEVLRLEVTDGDLATAAAISEAVIDQYLVVAGTPVPVEQSSALQTQRSEVVEALAEADAGLVDLRDRVSEDAALQTEEESLDRQIDLTGEQINRVQGLLDVARIEIVTASQRAALTDDLATAETELAELEGQLADIRTQRAALTEQSAAEAALAREVTRLESDLATIDSELARRELGPLVSSPVRAMSDATVETRSAGRAGIQGLAGGLLLGSPIAALLAYRARRRRLWLD